jgi:hypothetical protein
MNFKDLKVGDWVECIDNMNGVQFSTIGKLYKIESLKEPYIRIINDKGLTVGRHFSRFKLKSNSKQRRFEVLLNAKIKLK